MTQTPNGNKYALAALKERRASVAGEITACESHLRYLRDSLAHIDGTLRMLAPDSDPGKIAPKRSYRRVKLFGQGELNRLILGALRKAETPLSTAEIVAAVIKELGHGPDVTNAMNHRVRANLQYLHRERHSVNKHGSGRTTKWTLRESKPVDSESA
jgi:hypothetical protein